MNIDSTTCAGDILETVPFVMRRIRQEMRSCRGPDLSVPQLRCLAFLSNKEGASLSDVADHIGLALPSASKLVDQLVRRGLVTRETCVEDRRRVVLCLTLQGGAQLKFARDCAHAQINRALTKLSKPEQEILVQAMEILDRAFSASS